MASKIHGILAGVAIFFLFLIGWTIFGADAQAQSTKGLYVTTDDAPLREGPGNFHKVVTTLPKGININVVGREGYWLKVESKHGGKPGYIDEKFAQAATSNQVAQAKSQPASVAGPYRTLRELDLREGPGANHKVVARLPADIRVNVVRAEGEWLRIESKKGGKPGYVDRRDVERLTNR